MRIANKFKASRKNDSRGFTIMEVLVALVVLVIGLVSLAALFAVSIASMQTAQQDLIAKQKAREALECIISARDTAEITFDQIQNTSVTGGIFVTGMQPLYLPPSTGATAGIVGTVTSGTIESYTLPGPDGTLGTGDDVTVSLANYKRQIAIGNVLRPDGVTVDPDLRNVVVTVQFNTVNQGVRSFSVSGYVSRFR